MKIIPVVLSGGSGSRLWPLSRKHLPKQCLPLVDCHYSLLQQTLQRVSPGNSQATVIVCNENHRFLIAQQMQDIGQQNATLILEPEGRNTAPAIALAALELTQRENSDALMLVLPPDHVIRDITAFEQAVNKAVELAEEGTLVTFGIKPTRPETGYGYIKFGQNYAVEQFVEKPDMETAKTYLASGDYLWNSGMFLFSAETFLAELKALQPAIYDAVSEAYKGRSEDMDFVRVDKDAFATCPDDSIDYAVMEKTQKAKVVPYSGDWSDIGAWDALYDFADKDDNKNVLTGDVIVEDTTNCLIRSESKLVAAVGISDLVVVETADAILVMDKTQSQSVKKIVKRIQEQGRAEHEFHTEVHRPWGTYETMDLGERYQVKRIVVKPGQKLSVQMHHHRAEHWIVVSGTAKVYKGDQEELLSENQSTFIPLGTVHALENPGKILLELIEVQSGSYLGEDDIVRFSDRYGR
ncbi:mannose-1-phosphate guanylyltransferase/mannose-6-phosphate isomerase [Marinospirillum minutulum]|uniref:mannose-1-phosphate guanylyltransferase/mannose-6-phosphate isomerase n=1 Tax=Marinospirillum minutulum TaxID=64974 RepID=UPI0003FBAB31|nr:mannose-1-phosphate guanylyltransferase/mannose-6-phosphate isomerase [Marinospirillum minutulum]